MPIIVPPVSPGGGDGGRPPGNYIPAVRHEVPQVELTGNGDTLPLSASNGVALMGGIQGFDMPPVAVSSSSPGLLDGGLIERVAFTPRDVYLPLHLHAATTPALRALKKRLAVLVDPKRGDVAVRVKQPDGTTRTISGRYVGGMASTLSGVDGLAAQNVGIQLRCFDPAWLGPHVVAEFRAASGSPFLGSPFFPLHVVQSQALGDVTIINGGDDDAYIVVTVSGPGDDLEVSNGDRSWGIDTIGPTETIIFDGRRGAQTVADLAGASQWHRLTTGSQLWTLSPGSNEVGVSLTGATAATTVRIEYQERYLTAW